MELKYTKLNDIRQKKDNNRMISLSNGTQTNWMKECNDLKGECLDYLWPGNKENERNRGKK